VCSTAVQAGGASLEGVWERLQGCAWMHLVSLCGWPVLATAGCVMQAMHLLSRCSCGLSLTCTSSLLLCPGLCICS
jgi:hypothetical protein